MEIDMNMDDSCGNTAQHFYILDMGIILLTDKMRR